MTEYDVFELQLAEAMRDYAAEAPTEVEPIGLAHSIVTAHPRRSRLAAALGPAQRRSVVVWVLLGAALILGSLLGLAAAGALRTNSDDLSINRSLPIPDLLYGDWHVDIETAGPNVPMGTYTIDLGGASLIRSPGDMELDWAGRVDEILLAGPGTWQVLIRARGTCGDGHYTVQIPGVSAEGAIPTPDRLRLDATADGCADRVAILDQRYWSRPAPIQLLRGEAQSSLSFSEPFHFVVPDTAPVASMGQWGTRGGLRIGAGCCWDSYLLDDQPVNVNVCDPTMGRLADVPGTPDAVGDWLRSSSGLKISDPIETPVDGRTALRFDVESVVVNESGSPGCTGFASPLTPPAVLVGFRYYAIPTLDDTILYVVWSDEGSYPSVEAGADALVRSMTFD